MARSLSSSVYAAAFGGGDALSRAAPQPGRRVRAAAAAAGNAGGEQGSQWRGFFTPEASPGKF
eukprot:jgi/Chlat1/891/Chrsp107S01350